LRKGGEGASISKKKISTRRGFLCWGRVKKGGGRPPFGEKEIPLCRCDEGGGESDTEWKNSSEKVTN